MAEEKKDDKKADAKPAAAPAGDPFAEIVSILFGLMLLAYFVNGLFNSITSNPIFAHGWSGLTPQGMLLSRTRPIASLDHALNVAVVSINDTTVFKSPGDDKIGSQPWGATGTILQGPVTIGSVRYWYVDYVNPPDGWVQERDIAYLESGPTLIERIIIYLYVALNWIKLLIMAITLALMVGLIYVLRKLSRLRQNTRALMYPTVPVVKTEANPKWERIVTLVESQSDSDWRLAILEADVMLDSILDKLDLPGDTMGDRMKAVEPSDFTTIENAWEAHKIRNQIAHEGPDFQLSQREARRVIELYRTVFEEFSVI